MCLESRHLPPVASSEARICAPARASGQSGWRRRLLWTIWVNAAGTRCLPTRSPTRPRTAGASSSRGPQASRSGCRSRARWPEMRPRRRGSDCEPRQFEGVTLQFAKAPFGTDEKDVIAKLLKPWEDKTGAKVVHTIVPWNVEGATYATNYAGPEPVRRQLPDEHRPDRPRNEGRARGAEHQQVARLARVRRRPSRSSSPTRSRRARTRASSTACRASSAAPSSTTTRTCSTKAELANIPRTETELMAAAAKKVQKLGGGRLGPQRPALEQGLHLVLPLPRHPQPRHRHHLEGPVEGHLQQPAGGGGAAVLRRPDHEARCSRRSGSTTARRASRCSRPAGSRFLHDEPLRITSFRQDEAPVQVGLHQPGRGGREAHDLLDHRPLGDGLEGQEQGRRVGASSSSSPRPRSRTSSARTTAGRRCAATSTPARATRRSSGSTRYVLEGLGRAAHRPEDGAAHRRLRAGDRGRRDRQDVGQGRPGQGAEGRHARSSRADR